MGSCPAARCIIKEKGTDSWSLLLQKFPTAIMSRSVAPAAGRLLCLLRCMVHQGQRTAFDIIRRALKSIINKRAPIQFFHGSKTHCGNLLIKTYSKPLRLLFRWIGILGICIFCKLLGDSKNYKHKELEKDGGR